MSRVVREDGFTMVPDWFSREYVPAVGLKAASIAAYVVLRGCADADGYCFPSFDLIAYEGGMSRNTAARAVRALIEAAPPVVKVESKGVGTSHQYLILGRPDNMPPVPKMIRKNNDNRRRRRIRNGGPTPKVGRSVVDGPTPGVGRSNTGPTPEVRTTYPETGWAPTPELGRKYTHQEDTRRTHSVASEICEAAAPRVSHETSGALAPDTTGELSWGWHGLLTREQWDEYRPEWERVHGERLRIENTRYFPSPDTYADALAKLRTEQPRGPLREAS